MTHICVGKLTIIVSANGLLPGRRQAIIWTNAGILLNGPLRINFSGILSKILSFSFKKMHLKMSSAKWHPFCFGLNELNPPICTSVYHIYFVFVYPFIRWVPDNDSVWWRFQMETFSALLAFCAGNSPHKGQWRRALMFSLICAWINSWVNNREAGDLRRHRAHYDVIVMSRIDNGRVLS